MTTIFENNASLVYFFTLVIFITTSKIEDKQKIFLMYLTMFFLSYTKMLGAKEIIFQSMLISFVFLEYLLEDKYKLTLIKKFRYKVLDYLFMMILQYGYMSFLISIFFTSEMFAQFSGGLYKYTQYLAFIPLIYTLHSINTRKIEFKKFSEIFSYFERNSFDEFKEKQLKQSFYDILIDIEDKSYFRRENAYNQFSLSFWKYKKQQIFRESSKWGDISKFKKMVKIFSRIVNKIMKLDLRGYSTIEMQLLRNIAISHGYNHVYRRKIYEFVYSNILFKGLYEFYSLNITQKNGEFKKYLIYVYVHNVPTKINGVHFNVFRNAFGDNKPFETWTDEEFFVSCIGLSFRTINQSAIEIYKQSYSRIFRICELDREEIARIGIEFEKRKSEYL